MHAWLAQNLFCLHHCHALRILHSRAYRKNPTSAAVVNINLSQSSGRTIRTFVVAGMAVGSPRYRSLLSLLFLLLLRSISAQECLYQYMHQPTPELDCNPYGRELQLHCGLAGPLSPEFSLEWYSSNATDSGEIPLKLEHAKGYSVNSIVLDWKTGHYVRSVSSILLTGRIGEGHRGRCLWCQAKFDGIYHTLKSNVLCIKDESYYMDLDKCREAVIVNTSLVCANASKEFLEELEKFTSSDSKRSTADITPTNAKVTAQTSITTGSEQLTVQPSPSPSVSQTSTLAKITDAHKQSPSSMSLHTISMETEANALPVVSVTPTPPVIPVGPTTAGTLVTNTDIPEIKTEEEGKTSDGGQNKTESGLKSKSSLEGPLYAAIVFCVVFVVIIVLLLVAIVCLSKKKCGCLTMWIKSPQFWKKSKDTTTTNGQGHALGNTIVGGTDMHGMLESGLHGNHLNSVSIKEETDRSGKFHVRASVEIPQSIASELQHHAANSHQCDVAQRQKIADSKRKSRASLELPAPPILPPKPRQFEQESSGNFYTREEEEEEEEKGDYDHLHPVVVPDNNDIEEEHQYAELEESVARRSSSPPKKPPRSFESKEHYYHTLESSEESGMLRSASNSQVGSQHSGMDEYYAEPYPGPATSVPASDRLEELFDDPRYAVLFVDQDHLEHIHTHKSEVSRSRSTPSLVAVDIIPFSPAAPERRSLRAIQHKRFSVVNAQLVQPHH